MKTTTVVRGCESARFFSCRACSSFDANASNHSELLSWVRFSFSNWHMSQRRTAQEDELLLRTNLWKAGVGTCNCNVGLAAERCRSTDPPTSEGRMLLWFLCRGDSCGRTQRWLYRSWKASGEFFRVPKMLSSSERNMIRIRCWWNSLNVVAEVTSGTGSLMVQSRAGGSVWERFYSEVSDRVVMSFPWVLESLGF